MQHTLCGVHIIHNVTLRIITESLSFLKTILFSRYINVLVKWSKLELCRGILCITDASATGWTLSYSRDNAGWVDVCLVLPVMIFGHVCSSFCQQRELNSDKLLVLASKPVVIDLEFELFRVTALDSCFSGAYYNVL